MLKDKRHTSTGLPSIELLSLNDFTVYGLFSLSQCNLNVLFCGFQENQGPVSAIILSREWSEMLSDKREITAVLGASQKLEGVKIGIAL